MHHSIGITIDFRVKVQKSNYTNSTEWTRNFNSQFAQSEKENAEKWILILISILCILLSVFQIDISHHT